MQEFDYALIVVLVAVAGLTLASLLGASLGPFDPVEAVGRVLDWVAAAL
jgi:Flp pilus assembly pilin Flp